MRFHRVLAIVLLSVTLLWLAGIGIGALVWPTHSAHAQLASSAGFQFSNVVQTSGSNNNQIIAGAGILHTIVVGSGTASYVIVDTSVSACTGGTTIGTITTAAGESLVFDLQFKSGLCITTSAATNSVVTFN